MGTKSIREIIEGAIVAHLAAQTELAGVNIYKGLEVTTDTLPQAIVSCESVGNPPDLPEGLGNYNATVNVHLYTSADSSNALTNHRDRSAGILGAMQNLSAIKTVFTTQGDATCYDVTFETVDDGRGDRALGTMATFSVAVVLPA
ncbi:MAG: hypothetical protein ACK5XN_27375 [Bacteroidota bacterium]